VVCFRVKFVTVENLSVKQKLWIVVL